MYNLLWISKLIIVLMCFKTDNFCCGDDQLPNNEIGSLFKNFLQEIMLKKRQRGGGILLQAESH